MTEIGGRATLTMIGTTDAVTPLRQELRRLEALLDQLHSGGDPEVVAELAAPLRDHIDVTEGIVFPAIHGRAQDGVPLELLANGTQQHGDLLRLLDEPAAADADGDGAAATAGVLEEQLAATSNTRRSASFPRPRSCWMTALCSTRPPHAATQAGAWGPV